MGMEKRCVGRKGGGREFEDEVGDAGLREEEEEDDEGSGVEGCRV